MLQREGGDKGLATKKKTFFELEKKIPKRM